MYIRRPPPPIVASDEECFASFIDCMEASDEDMQMWNVVSNYLPLLRVLDKELHDSICRMDMGKWVVGEEIHKWISSWFLSLIPILRCRRIERCRARESGAP